MRILPVTEIIKKLNQMLVGYYHYYGITDNSKAINDFVLGSDEAYSSGSIAGVRRKAIRVMHLSRSLKNSHLLDRGYMSVSMVNSC